LGAGIASRYGAIGREWPQPGQGFDRGILARPFIRGENFGITAALRHGHRNDFVGKFPTFYSRDGALMAPQGVRILLRSGNGMLLGQVFCGFDHAGDDAKTLFWRYRGPGPGEPVVQRDGTEAAAVAALRGVEFHPAHAFRSTCQHHIGVVGLDHHGRVENRLQTGRTAAVELIPRHFDRQTRFQGAEPSDGGFFATGIAMAEDHVIDPGRIQSSFIQDGFDHGSAQLRG